MNQQPRSPSPSLVLESTELTPERQMRADRARLRHWLIHGLPSPWYLAAAVAAATLAAGGMVAGARGLLLAGALIVVAVPVIGFTSNQVTLTSKGRNLARTVKDVQALKKSDAEAFSKPLRTILRREHAGQGHISDALRQAVGQVLEVRRPPPPELWRSDDSGPDSTQPVRPSFWPSLTPAEQQALRAAGQFATFAPGTALCRQSESAELVFIIFSGLTKVHVAQPGGGRVIAIRGAGDVIGERAAFQVRSRSATVITIGTVQALVITTADFAAFLDVHPRVMEVLERGVYDRLTEVPPVIADSDTLDAAHWQGQNCSVFLADIAAFGGHQRNDVDRQIIRDEMYAALRAAFDGSGVPWRECHREDRGDGALVIVPPGIPTRSVVDPLLARLAAGLRQHNRRATQATRMQLRVALNVGPVDSDPQGVSGEAIIFTARLLAAPGLKKELARVGADLGVIVSPFIYDSVIKHAPGLVDPVQYRRLRFRVKESNATAWMYLSG